MNFHSLSKRQWVLLSVSVVIVGVAFWALQAGYLPEIGKFFAAEPGYVPSCAWYGEPVTPTQQCCSGFVPVPVTYAMPSPIPSYILNAGDVVGQPVLSSLPPRTILPTPTKTPPPPSYTPTPTPMPVQYCVLPGCKAVARQVYCIKAPCPPIVDIVCPSGITPPPPRPSVSPTPSTPVTITNPKDGASITVGSKVELDWAMTTTLPIPDNVDIVLLDDRAYNYVIALEADNNGKFIWDTSLPLQRLNAEGTVMLSDVSGSNLIIQVAGRGSFSSVWGRTHVTLDRGTLTPPPSVTPTPPVFQGISLGFGFLDPFSKIQIPLDSQGYGIDMFLKPVPGGITGAPVTAVSMRLRYHPEFLKVTEVQSPYFPEVLQAPKYTEASGFEYVEFTLGSGTKPAQINANDPAIKLIVKPLKAGQDEFIALDHPIITMPGSNSNAWRALQDHVMSVHMDIVAAAKPGDANGDGKVDIFDYNLVVSNFGKTGTNVPGDVNKDGKVDIFDYNLVISNFGK